MGPSTGSVCRISSGRIPGAAPLQGRCADSQPDPILLSPGQNADRTVRITKTFYLNRPLYCSFFLADTFCDRFAPPPLRWL